jgi:hypothetical protein
LIEAKASSIALALKPSLLQGLADFVVLGRVALFIAFDQFAFEVQNDLSRGFWADAR